MWGRTVTTLTLILIGGLGCDQRREENFPEQYIVVFKKVEVKNVARFSSEKLSLEGVVKNMTNHLAEQNGLEPAKQIFSEVVQGGVYEIGEVDARRLALNPAVAYVERDHVAHTNVVQTGAAWGLDRLDQVELPLNGNYQHESGSSTVNAYVIDTGVLTTHEEFGSRAQHGFDFIDNDNDATDCNGHGTHVAATLAGTRYGVAKNVKVHAVRVLNCYGSGQYSGVIAGIEWVARNHVKPAVANMSLGGPASQALDDAIKAAVAAGVTFIVAAGNEGQSACNSSPARESSAIAVGSTTRTDARSEFSNFGSCVDIFAPGTDIESAWYDSNSARKTISGTSMAAPHVAGVAALYLSRHPDVAPEDVRAAVLSGASENRIVNVGQGSPNLLLNTLFLLRGGGEVPHPTPTPTPAPDPAPPDKCDRCVVKKGKLARSGASQSPLGTSYSLTAGVQEYTLKGPRTADFDLFLYKRVGYRWLQVASSEGPTSSEVLRYKGASGLYNVRVYSYSGRGSYVITFRKK